MAKICANGYHTCFASGRTCSSRKAMMDKIVAEVKCRLAGVFARVVTLASQLLSVRDYTAACC